MSHDYHGNPNVILTDGCAECDDRVTMAGLCSLDPARIEVLWRRMIAQQYGRPELVEGVKIDEHTFSVKEGYQSNNEWVIGRNLYFLSVILERSGNPAAFRPGLFWTE